MPQRPRRQTFTAAVIDKFGMFDQAGHPPGA
jgi:hypothetical protein